MKKMYSSPEEAAMVAAIRREIYAGVAMHALIVAGTVSVEAIPETAVHVANGMVESLGPFGGVEE